MFSFFHYFIYNVVIHLRKRHNFVKIFILSIFNSSQKLIQTKTYNMFFFKFTMPKLVTPNISHRKRRFPKKLVFLKIQFHRHFWAECQKAPLFLRHFFISYHWKANSPRIAEARSIVFFSISFWVWHKQKVEKNVCQRGLY